MKLTYILCSKPSIMSFELIFLLHLLVKAVLFSQRMFVKPLETEWAQKSNQRL